jgi:hypothetical protein
MLDLTWDEVFRYRDGLHALIENIGRYLEAQGYDPKPGSRAAAERAEYSELDGPRTACHQALLLIDCVADHAFAMVNTLKNPGQTIAPWTCVRAMLEAGSRARWLMDMSIGTMERIERSMILRMEGLKEQRKALSSLNDQEKIPVALEKIKELEMIAEKLGLAPLKPMPHATDLSRDFLQDESTYRISSAMLHGHAWALTQLGFQRVDPAIPEIPEKHIDPRAAALLIYKAADCFARPVWDFSRHYAYDVVALESLYDLAYDSMGIGSDSEFRFWHRVQANSAYS